MGAGSRPWPYPDRSAYASRLFTTAYRSQTARYNRLIEDIRNDVLRIDPFFVTARYVLDMDRKREKALDLCHPTLRWRSATTRSSASRRTATSCVWVQGSLQERVASYQVALERMVIAAPSPVAVEAERSLTLLQQRISGYGALNHRSAPADPACRSRCQGRLGRPASARALAPAPATE